MTASRVNLYRSIDIYSYTDNNSDIHCLGTQQGLTAGGVCGWWVGGGCVVTTNLTCVSVSIHNTGDG